MKNEVERIAELFRTAGRVLFITGAGVSEESGIATFRGATSAFADGMTEDGIHFEEALSGPTFEANPRLSWKYFFRLDDSMRGKLPNAAHRAIAALQSSNREIWVVTQNIDGLHQDAGSRQVIELHGNLRRVICTHCGHRVDMKTFEGMADLPLCPECRKILRPDVVLYGERLPTEAVDLFLLEQDKGFDVVVSVGTTSIFDYVTMPILMAARRGIPTVEINPEETPVSEVVQFRLASPAGVLLERICELCQ